jgi:hypothetical protein
VYHNTQIGYVTLGASVAAMATTAAVAGRVRQPAVVGVAALLAAGAVLFSSLTIEVDDGEVRTHFGPGFWRKRFAVVDVAAVNVTRSAWWEGWGIRITPRGMLYPVRRWTTS